MSRFFDWTPDDGPGEVLPITAPGDWDALRDRYTTAANDPFERILEVAQAHDVKTVLIERRYIDADFRSEHAHFYASTFRRYPSVCHRLHFFAEKIPSTVDDLTAFEPSYRGYSVMRPLPLGPVGRTMLAPPPELEDGTVCMGIDEVHVFGWPLKIRAMPFISQDAQYMRCAHAVQWMVLQHAHLTHALPRRLPEDVHEASRGGTVVGRQLPSEGLSVEQLLASLQTLDLSPGKILLPSSRAASRLDQHMSLPAIVCRYVNSQMPPIVVSPTHAWVVVGYRRREGKSGHDNVILYRHDDAMGPYIRVDDPWSEPKPPHTPWVLAVPPLQPKMFLTAERAEAIGRYWLTVAGRQLGITELTTALADHDLTFRTYAAPAHRVKADGDGRLHADLSRAYRALRISAGCDGGE